MKHKKLLFFDIDGTLYWDGRVSERNVEAMKRVQEDGNLLILNTGRSIGFAPRNVLGCVDWDGMICGAAYVTLGGEVLHSAVLPPEALRDMCRFCEENGVIGIFEGEGGMYLFCPTAAAVDDFEQRRRAHPEINWARTSPELIESGYDGMRITKAALGGRKGLVYPEHFSGVYVLDMGGSAEVYLNGYDKSTGMRLIGRRLCMGRGDMLAFGDSKNDVDMLKYAGVSAVMEHAPEEALRYATLRLHSSPDGVAECLQELFAPLFA